MWPERCLTCATRCRLRIRRRFDDDDVVVDIDVVDVEVDDDSVVDGRLSSLLSSSSFETLPKNDTSKKRSNKTFDDRDPFSTIIRFCQPDHARPVSLAGNADLHETQSRSSHAHSSKAEVGRSVQWHTSRTSARGGSRHGAMRRSTTMRPDDDDVDVDVDDFVDVIDVVDFAFAFAVAAVDDDFG
jgi:hypothetical protein